MTLRIFIEVETPAEFVQQIAQWGQVLQPLAGVSASGLSAAVADSDATDPNKAGKPAAAADPPADAQATGKGAAGKKADKKADKAKADEAGVAAPATNGATTTTASADEIIRDLTAIYRDGDAPTREKIVKFRDECGVSRLRDLKPAQMVDAASLLAELSGP